MPQTVVALKDVRTDQLTKLLDHNSLNILEAIATMTPDSLQGEGIKDLSVAMSLHLEKRALLRKEPTQRIQIEDRRHLNELLQAVHDEMLRRDLTVETDPVTQESRVWDGDLGPFQRNRIEDGAIVERPD